MATAEPDLVRPNAPLDVVFDFGPCRDFADAGALDEQSTEVLLSGWAPEGYVFGLDDVEIVVGGP